MFAERHWRKLKIEKFKDLKLMYCYIDSLLHCYIERLQLCNSVTLKLAT